METRHAVQRIIKDISNDDLKIQVTGYVISRLEGDLVLLKDNTGEIKINISEVDFPFKKEDLINIIGELNMSMSGEKYIQAKIVQDVKNLNFPYYEKLYYLKKELEQSHRE